MLFIAVKLDRFFLETTNNWCNNINFLKKMLKAFKL